MKKITVTASKHYDVLIGNGIMANVGTLLCALFQPCKAAIISDSNVWPLYGNTVQNSLVNAGFHAIEYVFPAGEQSKNGKTYLDLLNFLAENHLTRSDCLIALGGGVTGDLTGFAAATYLRGVAYVQIPTTLLAMVDSSVGGKTAIDLPSGKNLAGAFCQPNLVLCDTESLLTLPESVFCDGCAEVIKYGILFDAKLFSHLEMHGLNFDREYVISRCVALKRDVVALDEFDTGVRQKLNLGHTIGHGVEFHSQYTVSHGRAVAIGLATVSRAAAAYQICTQEDAHRVCHILSLFCLPSCTEYTAEQLCSAAMSDKKRSGNIVNLIIPEGIGICRIQPFEVETLKFFIEAGI